MHPLLRSRRAYAAYLLAWLPLQVVYAFLFAAGGRIGWWESVAITFPTTVVLSFCCLFPYYTCRALPLGARPNVYTAIAHAIPAMFFSGVVLAVAHVSVAALDRLFPSLSVRFSPLIPVLAVMVILTYLLSTALHYVVQVAERSQRAEILSREAQLKALKAQVNPHFLFNSLNSISALTAISPGRARDMCIRLSEFLRASLRVGERSSIQFAEELALVQTYLDVERVRFGERLQVLQTVAEGCASCEVPPLVIQPLVENAIKHGIATLVTGGHILIDARVQDHRLAITIENNFDPDAPVMSKSGFGIANVRNRLEARYGAAATLHVTAAANQYRAVLSIPAALAKKELSPEQGSAAEERESVPR